MNTLSDKLNSLIKAQKASEKFLISFLLVLGLSWIIFMIGSNYFFVRRIIAEQVCPLTSDLDGKVHGQQYLTATSSVNSFDCSTLDIVVANDGEIIFQSYKNGDSTINGDYSGVLSVNNLTIEQGGKITADGQGYLNIDNDNNNGRGGDGVGLSSGGGGGYGGAGGEGVAVDPNPSATTGHSYGSAENPVYLGGAGGNSGTGALGGNGGGAIKINVANTLQIDGTISANGQDGKTDNNSSAGGAGAGGSIWLEASIFSGSGTVKADGGISENAQYKGGGGGGGRINMFCSNSNTYTGTLTAQGGTGQVSFAGGNGSILGATCRPNSSVVLKQFKSDQITEVPVGTKTSETQIYLSADLSDPDFGDILYLQVELRKISDPFTNNYTHTQVLGYSNPQSCLNGSQDCGKVLITGLDRLYGYHWQARVKDNHGAYSSWVSYGNNGVNDEDFYISGVPSNIVIQSGNSQSGVVGGNLSEPFAVTVSDTNGLPIEGASVSWSITDGKTGGKLIDGYTTQTDINGLATNHYTLGTIVGQNIVVATISGTSTSVTFNATGVHDQISSFNIDSVSVALVDQSFSITAKPYDQYGNLLTDYVGTPTLQAVKPMDISSNATGSLSISSITFVSGDNGIHTESLSFNTAESIKIKISDGNATGYTNSIAIVTEIGSCPDADGIIDTNQDWIADLSNQGVFDCRNVPEVIITNNSTLTLTPYNNGNGDYSDDFGVHILANDLTIEVGSVMNANSKGYSGDTGPGAGLYNGINGWQGTGASYGGYAPSRVAYGSVYEPVALGSGGGGSIYGCSGSRGGGSIHLTVESDFTNNGILEANGENSSCSNGSGGSIWIDTNTIAGNGYMATNGATGSNGGAGGRISLYYNTNTNYNLNTTGIRSFGGTNAGPGTIYLEEKDVDIHKAASLLVDNQGANTYGAGLPVQNDTNTYNFKLIKLTRYGHLTLMDNESHTSRLVLNTADGLQGDDTRSTLNIQGTMNYIGGGSLVLDGVTLEISGNIEGVTDLEIGGTNSAGMLLHAKTWHFNDTVTYDVFDNIRVKSNGLLSLASKTDTGNLSQDYGVNLSLDNLTIDDGGVVSSTAYGYPAGSGPGAGAYGENQNGYGAGYGGISSGTAYGSVFEPSASGSGGGNSRWGCAGAAGGGAMKINVAQTLNNDGIIESNGQAYSCSNGAGGAVWINAHNMSGIGTISTDGSTGGNGGAGGRIAIYYDNNIDFNINTTGLHSYGGPGAGAGTIYIEHKNVDTNKQGTLLVDNQNRDASSAGLPVQTDTNIYHFKSIQLTRYGHLNLMDDGTHNSVLQINTGTELTGDNTKPSLIVSGTLDYTGTDTLILNGVTIDVSGYIQGVDNIQVGGTNSGGLTLRALTWHYGKTVTHDMFSNITVKTNGLMTLVSKADIGNDVDDYGVNLTLDNLTIENGGIVSATGYGYGAGSGPGAGVYNGRDGWNGAGGTHGGSAPSRNSYGSVYEPITMGSGGGGSIYGCGGSSGGGAIKLMISGALSNNGTIESNGGAWSCTNGAGGSIWVDTNTISGNGSISTDGAMGGWGGSGGRIALYFNNNAGYNLTPSGLHSFGGVNAGPGTIYIEQKGVDTNKAGTIMVDNRGYNYYSAELPAQTNTDTYNFKLIKLTNYGNLNLMDDANHTPKLILNSGNGLVGDNTRSVLGIYGTLEYTGGGLLTIDGVSIQISGNIQGVSDVQIGGVNAGGLTLQANTWYFNKNVTYDVFNNITVKGNGLLTMISKANTGDLTQDYGVTLSLSNLTVEEGGVISATGYGYGPASGPGAGAWSGGSNGYGGAYGGNTPSVLGYGSVYEPTASGSGGGYSRWGCGGSAGGGAIKILVTNSFVHNGSVVTNGATSDCHNGSGGSIWIDTDSISGIGSIAANGAEGGYGGSGGRVALYYNTNTDFNLDIAHIHAYGGPNAGAGTVYIENKVTDSHRAAKLLVDNQGRDTYSAALPIQSDSTTYNFSLIQLTRYGHLELLDNESHTSTLVLNSGSGLQGDDTRPILTVSGTLNYTGQGLLGLSGISLKINGDVQGITDLEIGGASAAGMILNAKTWHFNKTVSYDVFNNISIKGNGLLTLISKADTGDSTQDYGVHLTLDDLTIEPGGKITATGTGWGESTGPGGGGYGGWGAPGPGLHGNLYGSIYEPTTMGSGGGGSYGWGCSGSNGGGVIKLTVNNDFVNNGTIESRGGAWSCVNGAGGSIWVDANTIAGSGTIDANGAVGGYGGTGGRIAVYYNTNVDYNISAVGAHAFGGYLAGPGTVYFENKTTQTVTKGDLILSNNGNTGNAQTFTAGIYKFNSVNIDPNVTVNISGKTDNQSIKDALIAQPLKPDANTLALWHLDESSQSNLINTANISNTGSPTSEVNTITGKYGNGIFTSSGQYVSFNPITLPSAYTIDAWMLFPLPNTSEGWRSIIGRLEGTYHHIMIHQNGELGIYNGGWYGSGYNINSITQGWHHIALTVKDNSKFYIDGQLVGTVNTVNTGNISVIGNYNSGTSWGGGIDDVRITSKELTASEVDAIYYANVPAEADSNTLALWNMDQVIKNTKVFGDKEFNDGGAINADIVNGGRFANARSFNGTNSYIFTQKYMANPTTFSYQLWMNTTAQTGGTMLAFENSQKQGANSLDRNLFMTNDGKITFGVYTNTTVTITSPNSYNDGDWHFITATLSPANGMYLYVDGVLVASNNSQITGTIYDGFFKIGYGILNNWPTYSGYPYFTGLIDEVKISGNEVSAQEVGDYYLNQTELFSDENTIGLWHFNEQKQGDIVDSGIVGNKLISNNTTYSTGKFDNARYFNGVDSYMTAPAGFADFTAGFTFEFWANPQGANGNNTRFIDFGNGCPNDNIIISRNGTSNDMLIEVFQGGSLNSSTVISSFITDNEWHHYAITLSQNGMLEVLKDGIVFKNIVIGFPSNIIRNNNYVGKACSGGAYYKGYLDEVRILNKGLTTDEINADYYGVSVEEYKIIYQTNAFGSGVIFDIADHFNLAAGATINGVGKGYGSNQGSGKGDDSTNSGAGGGGGYGGDGGNAQTLGNGTPDAFGGKKYGDQNRPYALGSGGGRSTLGALGGNGGGALAILNPSGITTIAGTINVSGSNGLTASPGGGGGAGGSIFVLSGTANITGNLIANGGSGGDDVLDGGTGGGGRISLLINGDILDSTALSNNISVQTGVPTALGTEGQSGTYPGLVVLPQINFSEQLKTNDVQIPIGGTTNEDTVKMKVQVSSQDASESNVLSLRAQVEIAKTNENFSVLGSTLISSGTSTYSGGTPVEVEAVASSLAPGEQYKWRTRVYDVTNDLYGEWLEYGSNGNSPDFVVGAATSLSVVSNKITAFVGEDVSMTVSARDANNNVDINFVGIVDFEYIPTSLTEPDMPLSYQFNGADDGIHTFTNGFKFYQPGTYQIIAKVRNNATLIGFSQNITVTAAPTATPVPTNTATPTNTQVPTQIPGEPTFTPTVIPTDTVVPTSTVVPSVIVYVSNTPYIIRPTPTVLAKEVIISNLTKTLNEADKSVKICWDTNINTIGYISFGLVSDNLFTNITSWENSYGVEHCITINNINTKEKYIFKITSVSEQSKEKTLQDTFGTKITDIPVLPETGECITVKPYAINAHKDILIQYTTPHKATCSVMFGEKTDDLLFRATPFETTSILNHDATLSTKLFSQNLYYEINCNVEFPSGAKACSKTDLIPYCKFGDCNKYEPVVTENFPVISPIVTLPILTTILAVNTISNPQFILYAFLWFRKSRNKKTWGIVYDEKGGKPVAYAIVKLFDISNKLIQREITGTDGKYGFILDKGKYKIEVQHNEYKLYKDLVNVVNNDDNMARDIPLVRNIKSKPNILSIAITGIRRKLGLINNILVAFGTVFSIIATVLSPILFNYIILAIYLIQFILMLIPQIKRNYGIVKTPSGERVSNAFVRIYDIKEERQVDVILTDDKGRYKFKIKPGQYLVKVDKENYIFPSERVKNVYTLSNEEKFIKVIVKKDYLNLDILLDKKQNSKKLMYNAFGHKSETNTKPKMRNPFD